MPGRPKVKNPAYVIRLKTAFETQLARLGILPSHVLVESVPGTRLYRFRIVAAKFSKLPHIERQDLVWNIVRQELGPREQLHVSTITTLTPSESKDAA